MNADDAWEKQLEAYRRMTGEERLGVALRLHELSCEVARAGIRHQNPTASPEEVDRIFTSCFGHRLGPLQTADLIGLDTILASIEVLYESFNDSKYRPCPRLKQMVDAGLHGRKSGAGFYAY